MKPEYEITVSAENNIPYIIMMVIFALSVLFSDIPYKNIVIVGIIFISMSMSLSKSVIRARD